MNFELTGEGAQLPAKVNLRFIAWLLLLAMLAGVAVTSPSESAWGLRQVPNSKILVIKGATSKLSRNINSAQNPLTLDEYQPGTIPSPVQFHIASRYIGDDRLYFAAGVRQPVRQFVNGLLTQRSDPQNFTGIGFSDHYLIGPRRSVIVRGETRYVDFVEWGNGPDADIGAFFVGSKSNYSELQSEYSRWTSLLAIINLLAGLAALLGGIAGLIYGQNRNYYLGGAGLGLVMLSAAAPSWLPNIAAVPAFWLSAGLIGVSGFLIAFDIRNQNRRADPFMITCCLFMMAAGFCGFLFAQLDQAGFDYFMMQHFIALAALPFAFLIIPRQHFGDIRNLLQQLELSRQAIGEREEVIEEQERQLQDQVRRQAVMEERQRFVRDMHDGIGGQLLSLLMRVRAKRVDLENVEEELEGGLTDLRLVVDSLDHTGASLAQALAMFKTRASQQLDAVEVDMQWSEEGDIAAQNFASREILSVYRIMQEALSNALRHAKPSAVNFLITAGGDVDGMRIAITDNGKGFDDDAIKAGRGLANMCKRAEQLGGALEIGPAPAQQGTCVTLTLPSDRADQA